MPDPISVPSSPSGVIYDFDQNVCLPAPLAAPPRPSQAPAAGPESACPSLPPGAQQLVESHESCAAPTLKAVATCGQAVVATMAATPTIVGPIIVAVLGGIQCGLASAEASDCFEKNP